MIKLLLLFFSFSFAENSILFSIEKQGVFSQDFFKTISYNEWEKLDSLKKDRAFNSFLEKELIYYDALSIGLDLFPKNKATLQTRFNHLLVNNTYEALVAFPLIDNEAFSLSKKHIKEEVSAYHLLVGYEGCQLPGSFTRSKKEAFSYIDSLKKSLSVKLDLSDSLSVVEAFSRLSLSFSEDPSVKDNSGYIGWISWGRVMSSFQQEAFNLKPFVVSEPVLTPYGYHLILIVDKRPSQYAYYNPSLLDDLSKKICLQSIPFDSLRAASSAFDSSLVSSDRLIFNNVAINKLVSIVKDKELGGFRGNKGAYLEWFSDPSLKDVYFVYDKKGFGLQWFLYHLKKTPSTRIGTLSSSIDVKNIFRSFLLQEKVISLGRKNKVDSSPFFVEEYTNHKKNILKSEYLSFLTSKIITPDSSIVKKRYNEGLYRGDFIAPERVVYTEISTQTENEINAIYNQYLLSRDFKSLLKKHPGKTSPPTSFSKNRPITVAAFSLKEGEVAAPLKNKKGDFSLIYLDKIIKEVPHSLDRVYKQIERKIKKEQKDSIKINLFPSLKKKYKLTDISLP